MSDLIQVTGASDESRDELIALLQIGATLDFRGANSIDQGWVDALTLNGQIDRCLFFRCSFVGDIAFTGLRFTDDDLNFGHCNFPGNVSFRDAEFPGSGRANFDRIRVAGSADFRGCDFDDRVCRWFSARFGGEARFDAATLGRVAYLQAVYSGDVSFAGTRFGSEETHFGSAVFESSVDLSGVVPTGSVLYFDGPTASHPSRVTTSGIDVAGRVVLSGAPVEAPFAALESPSEAGAENPLKADLRLTFESGPLAGESYDTSGPASVVRLLELLGEDQDVVVERTDMDFGVRLTTQGPAMKIAVLGDMNSSAVAFARDTWFESLRTTLLTLEIPT